MPLTDRAWVLIIEDVRDQAELWADVCAEAGFNAMTAGTGVHGYRKAVESQPAIIMLDLMLPDVDGWDVCRRLKTDGATQHIPIVIVTAREDPHGERRAAEAGCAAYLRKPCPPVDVVAVIRRILGEQAAV